MLSRTVFGPTRGGVRAVAAAVETHASQLLARSMPVLAAPVRAHAGCSNPHHHHDRAAPAAPAAAPGMFRLQTKSVAPKPAPEPVATEAAAASSTEGVYRSNSAVEKAVCDPYELGGKPLPRSLVAAEMKGIDTAWEYDEDTKVLRRVVSFVPLYKRSLAEQEAHAKKPVPGVLRIPRPAPMPGTVQGPIEGPAACAHLAQVISNICLNNDHWAYNISITPRKSQVVVELKTVGRAGLTHADFYLAMQIDAVLLTTFRIY